MAQYIEKTVESWLREIDYQFVGYMPQKEALLFVNFIKEVNGGSEENETPIVHLKMMDSVFNKERRCAVLCHRGVGKQGTPNSAVMTERGWITMKEVVVGDRVFTRNGTLAEVDYKTPLQDPDIYEIELSDGTKFEVGDEHNHIVWMYRKKEREKVLTTKELLSRPLFTETKNRSGVRNPKGQYTYSIPLIEPLQWPERELPIDPYALGYWLANGTYNKGVITCHLDDSAEILGYFSQRFSVGAHSNPTGNTFRFYLLNNLFKVHYGHLARSKSIPKEYAKSSVNQRLELLRGLMDGDGHIAENGGCSYSSFSKRLAQDVRDLARSLGAISYVKEYIRPGKPGTTEYRVVVNIKLNPFRLKRKADKWKPTNKTSRAIVAIRAVGKKGGYCIHVNDPTHSYLTDGFTVTHNTTLFGEYLILFIAAFGIFPGFGLVNLILYVTDSIENGVKNLRRNVEFRYGESEFLRKIIPDKRVTVGTNGTGYVGLDAFENSFATGRKFTDIRLEFRNNKGHILVVKGYGAKTGVRGAKELGKRPSIAILDDLISDSDAESPTVIKTIENTVYKAVSKALHPTRQKMVWLGTPFNARDPLYKAVESGAWQVSVYPICEHFPCTKEEFRGSWEDRFSYTYVKDEYEEAQKLKLPENFNQELMLRIMSDEDRLINDANIQWYSIASLKKNKGAYNYYITTDFATSESQASDYSVISVWAINNKGFWYWVDGICKKQTMDVNVDDLFRLVQEWLPLSVGIEVSGQQGGFVSLIERQMLDKNIFFNITSDNNSSRPGIRPNTNKMVRFNLVLPWFKAKMMHFPEELKTTIPMVECMDELGLAAKGGFKSKHDDFIDSISMLGSLVVWRPSEAAVMKKSETGVWEDETPEDTIPSINSYIV